MKSFRQPECVSEIRQRIQTLSAESPRQWGRMTVNQMVCHLHTGKQDTQHRPITSVNQEHAFERRLPTRPL